MRHVLIAGLLITSGSAYADDAVVGNGTPASCTEAALDAALGQLYPGANFSGGILSFNCGSAIDIAITAEKNLTDATVVEGNGVSLVAMGTTRILTIQGAQSQVTVRRLNMRNGHSASFGGAIYVSADTSLQIEDSTLSNHQSDQAGGAIYLEAGASLGLLRMQLVGNQAPYGGAIASNGNLTVTDSAFSINQATTDQGGAIQQWFGETQITGSYFGTNDARNGGAILLRGSPSTILDSAFENNLATERGGAIAMYEGGTLTLRNSTLYLNFASEGGAVHIGGSDLTGIGPTGQTLGSDALIEACTFTDNQASLGELSANRGGALFVFGLSDLQDGVIARARIQQTTFRGNSATDEGGAIYSRGALEVGLGSTLSDNSAYVGGALLADDSCVQRCPLNVFPQRSVSDSVLSNNQATDLGGAIFSNDRLLGIARSNLLANRANRGGGIAQVGYNDLGLHASAVVNNVATTAGGGLWFLPALSGLTGMSIVNSTFTFNDAASGGDIHIDTGPENTTISLTLYHSTLIDSTAAQGKSIFASGSSSADQVTFFHSVLRGDPNLAAQSCNGAVSFLSNDHNFLPIECLPQALAHDVQIGPNFDLHLGALTQTNSPTWHFVPAANSPLLDHAPCPSQRPTDQRGLTAPFGLACDVGSVERQARELSEVLFADGFEN